jgi:hypothetical protein
MIRSHAQRTHTPVPPALWAIKGLPIHGFFAISAARWRLGKGSKQVWNTVDECCASFHQRSTVGSVGSERDGTGRECAGGETDARARRFGYRIGGDGEYSAVSKKLPLLLLYSVLYSLLSVFSDSLSAEMQGTFCTPVTPQSTKD